MSYPRDVLFMIGAGLAQGKIKAPDIEMMLSDGPKRVPLLELVTRALAEFPQPLTGPDAEQIPEPPRARPTPPSAHPALAAANEWAELTADWDRLPFGTRAYYDALAKCDAAWERIAAAVRAPADATPAAWVVYAPNGNVRLWSTEQRRANECAEANGLTVTPLYAHPPADSAVPDGVPRNVGAADPQRNEGGQHG